MKLEKLLEQVAAWSKEGESPTQYLYTALVWRCNSSLRRQRREVKRGDTRIPVPVPDPSLLIPFADPHNLNARRRLPDSTESTSVPVVRLARVAVPEQHPLEGILQLSSRRGWARLGEHFRHRVRAQLRTFFYFGEKCEKTPLPGSSERSASPVGE